MEYNIKLCKIKIYCINGLLQFERSHKAVNYMCWKTSFFLTHPFKKAIEILKKKKIKMDSFGKPVKMNYQKNERKTKQIKAFI